MKGSASYLPKTLHSEGKLTKRKIPQMRELFLSKGRVDHSD